MLLFRELFSLIMVVLNVSIKSRMGERKFGFNLIFKSKVKSIPGWSKDSNGSDVKKSGGYHTAMKVKCIFQTLQKVKG